MFLGICTILLAANLKIVFDFTAHTEKKEHKNENEKSYLM